jgi:hypothetical protein
VIVSSLGLPRNNQLSPGPALKLNTGLLQLPRLKCLGCECFSKNLKYFYLLLILFGVTTLLRLLLLLILCFMLERSILKWIITLFDHDVLLKFISNADQIADIFTKGLSSARFLFLKSKLMVLSSPINLRGNVNMKIAN